MHKQVRCINGVCILEVGYASVICPKWSSDFLGLQIRVGRFDSGSRLQEYAAVAQLVERNLAKVEVESSRLFCRSTLKRESVFRFPFFASIARYNPQVARVVKLVNTRDLKSLGLWLYGFDSRPGHQ